MRRHYYIAQWGGLGNQLYVLQYAYRLAKERGSRVTLFSTSGKLGDTSDRKRRSTFSELAIMLGFRLQYWPNNTCRMIERAKRIPLLRRFIHTYDEPVGEHAIYVSSEFRHRGVINLVYGYFQSALYTDLEFIEKLRMVIEARVDQSAFPAISERDVALHIRRGDFLVGENQKIFRVFSAEYYLSALERMSELTEISQVYIFSDDFDAIGGEIRAIEAAGYTVSPVQRNSVLGDMYQLTRFRNYVLANSTFSWWGAYLSIYGADVRVVVPEYPHIRVNPDDTYYPDHWIRV